MINGFLTLPSDDIKRCLKGLHVKVFYLHTFDNNAVYVVETSSTGVIERICVI